jgi:predicted transcriptional regulator
MARTLERQAAERGVSVAELLADLAKRALSGDAVAVRSEADHVAELDRRWADAQQGKPPVPHDRVVHWLETWGTPSFRPWPKQ